MSFELIRDSVNWDRSFEQGLPDCRAHDGDRRLVPRGRTLWERVYCANCGIEGGLVTADWCAHIFFICDECVKFAPKELRAAEVPAELVEGRPDGGK